MSSFSMIANTKGLANLIVISYQAFVGESNTNSVGLNPTDLAPEGSFQMFTEEDQAGIITGTN